MFTRLAAALIGLAGALALAQAPPPALTESAAPAAAAAREICSQQGPRAALPKFEHALALYQKAGDRKGEAITLGHLGNCYKRLGEHSRTLALAAETGLKKEEADWLRGKGSALLRLGKYNAALEAFQQALQVYEKAGLKRELLEALNDLGSLHVLLGDPASAEHMFRRAIDVARAFLFAGSLAVLASLWEVDDLSTLRLMRNFYRHLEKSGKATALAEAQRALRTGRYRHPYFWAPFVLVGAM